MIWTTCWFEIYYFYISQTKSSLDRIFYKVVYHHIIYMCDFFCEFRWLFYRDLHRFSRRSWFLPDLFPLCFHSYSTIMNVLTLTATIEINPACTKIMGYILFGAPPMQPWIYKIYVFSVLITKKTDVLAPGKSWRSNTFTRGVKKLLECSRTKIQKLSDGRPPNHLGCAFFWLDIKINEFAILFELMSAAQ